jgi:hypothetical protein
MDKMPMHTNPPSFPYFLSVFGLVIGLTACSRSQVELPTPSTSTPAVITATSLAPTPLLSTPTATAEQATFVGHYRASFEVSSFVPCSMSGLPGYGKGYWLEADPTSAFYEHYRTMIAASSAFTITGQEDPGAIVFVRFVGRLTLAQAPNSVGYGHMGIYPRQITVLQLLEMRQHANNQCAA